VILPKENDWCNATCEEQVTIFNDTKSSTWKTAGIFTIPELDQYISGYNGEGSSAVQPLWGIDNVFLGRTAKDRNITSTYVTLTTGKRFQIGTFGLAVGITGPPGALQPNFINSLWSTKVIPSRSFGYTAGSANRTYNQRLHLHNVN
jgi:hypothetical protein